MDKQTFQMHPIGYVHSGDDGSWVEILEPYRPALEQLDQFGHAYIVWWADQHDNEESRRMLQTRPPYAEDKLTGVFACRSEYRPNPIALTVCKVLKVEEQQGRIVIGDIDAFDGTHILDLKPYFPVCDRVRNASIPEWLAGWPSWMPERGLGLVY